MFLRCRTDGWYVVTKGKTRLHVLFFCKRADCLVAKLTSDSVLRISFLGYPRLLRRNLNLERLSLNIVSKEFVLRSRRASPLVKPRFTPGMVSVGL